MISAIGLDRGLHMDFGSYAGYGIPYQVVTSATPGVTVTFDYDDESDHVPYPIPASPLIEGGSDAHILLVDSDACRLYELYAARNVGGAWQAGSGATWDLTSNALRPETWTSADAAGLPILPGLVRYDEVAARRDPPRAALHDQSHPDELHLPGPPPGGRVELGVAPADGSPRPTPGRLRHESLLADRPRHRGRPQALRDDPGRQRFALVYLGRQRSRVSTTTPCTNSTSSPAATSRPWTRPDSSTAHRRAGAGTHAAPTHARRAPRSAQRVPPRPAHHVRHDRPHRSPRPLPGPGVRRPAQPPAKRARPSTGRSPPSARRSSRRSSPASASTG